MKIVSLKITEIFKSLMKNNILQLHNQSERTVEKIDCPFSRPMSRKERPPMTKPREKTREKQQRSSLCRGQEAALAEALAKLKEDLEYVRVSYV